MAHFAQKINSTLKLLHTSFHAYTSRVVALAILGFMSGILEGIGVNAIIPLFAYAQPIKSSATDTISRFIEGALRAVSIKPSVVSLVILIPLLFIIKAILQLGFDYVKIRIITHYERQTRQQLFNQTLSANWSYVLNQKIGYLEKTIMIDVSNGAYVLSYISEMILLLTSLVIYALVAVNISTTITTITLGIGGVLFIILKPLAGKTRRMAKREEGAMKEVSSFINETILGLKSIKSLAVETETKNQAEKFFNRFKYLKIRNLLLLDIGTLFVQPVGVVFIAGLFAVSYYTADFDVASFAVIVYLVQKIFTYVQSVQNKIQNIFALLPYLSNIARYQETLQQQQESTLGTTEFQFTRSLSFDRLSFQYQPEKNIIADMSFTVAPGEMIGIIGPSGAGKTTIVDLLLRLFEPTEGKILLDGLPASAINIEQWRRRIGYVSQDVFLINNTFTENIRFFDPTISDQDIKRAAELAHIAEFIDQQPLGYATMVGERGLLLSGGQRQRVILARVLARRPDILILDEATSALDNESEQRIQEAIKKLKGSVTVLAIAHRLSTVMDSDRLLVVKNGQIVEQGPPQELLADKDSYFYKTYHIRN